MNKGNKKILYINICYGLVFRYDKDNPEIKNIHVIFSEEFVKFLRECQLDSLEKFTKKFKYYNWEDIPEYLTTTNNDSYYVHGDENKIRNRKALNDVSKYFSNKPSALNSYHSSRSLNNSVILSVDQMNDIIYSSSKLRNDVLSTKFNKILSKNIKKILPVPKSVSSKLRKFNQSLRKKTATKRKRKSSSSSATIRNSSSSKKLRRSKRIRNLKK